MDHDTREWFDGVLTASARKVIKEPADTHNWIICDGDIDPEWAEALNSVLDDNRLLTIPNGERIQFGTNVNFIFETDNLRFVSPANISRLSVIFLSEEDVDVKPMIASWIAQQPPEYQGSLATLQDEFDLTFNVAVLHCIHTNVFEGRASEVAPVLFGHPLAQVGASTALRKGDDWSST